MNEQQKMAEIVGGYRSIPWLIAHFVLSIPLWGVIVGAILTTTLASGSSSYLLFGLVTTGMMPYLILLCLNMYHMIKGNEPVIAGMRKSRSEVLDEIRARIQEQPYVRWIVACGRQVVYYANGQGRSFFQELHRETKDWYFEPTESWKTETPSGPPSEEIFKKDYAYFTIKVYCLPGELINEAAYVNTQKQFLSSHNGHDQISQLHVPSPIKYTFFTCKDDQLPYYLRKGSKVCFLFGLFGLSFFFRLFVYCKIGKINYVITKRHDSSAGVTIEMKDVVQNSTAVQGP